MGSENVRLEATWSLRVALIGVGSGLAECILVLVRRSSVYFDCVRWRPVVVRRAQIQENISQGPGFLMQIYFEDPE